MATAFKTDPSASKYPAISLVRKDPMLAAMASKLSTPLIDTQQRDDLGNRKNPAMTMGAFKNALGLRAKRNADAASLMRLLPDVELSAQILVSSILSPKDMTSVELTFLGPKNVFSPDLSNALLNRVRTYFEESYKIKPLLPEMLRDVLFEKGSYPVAVLPENAIDDFINGKKRVSTEALKDMFHPTGVAKNIGVLGNSGTNSPAGNATRRGVSMESLLRNPSAEEISSIDNRVCYVSEEMSAYKTGEREEYLTVTDNFVSLKIPKLNAAIKQEAVRKHYVANGLGFALEAATSDLSDHQLERLFYSNRQQSPELMASFKKPHQLERRSVGEPLVMKLPSESVIPVHVPGNVKHHIGYFILLDQEGNPLEVPDGDAYYQGLSRQLGAGGNSLASNIIRKVETNMGTGGSFDTANQGHIDMGTQVYADMVERDLLARLKNGYYADTMGLARPEEVYRLMLSRVLSKKYTQILYLPIEYLTYIAFKYGDDGVGRSFMDDTSVINTLRTVILFNDVMSSVKNSIGQTKVSMTVPEHDPNPLKTVEIAQDEIVRSRMLNLPMSASNPAEIMEFIQRAGYQWEFTGNKALPDLKFEFQESQRQFGKTDTELSDMLRKASIMAHGLSPETVENGLNQVEFATSAVFNNVLLSKRVLMHQEMFTPMVSDHLRKVAGASDSLVQDLKQLIKEKIQSVRLKLDESVFKEQGGLSAEVKERLLVANALKVFLTGFYVELPKPSSVTLTNQLDDFKNYGELLDEALNAYISTEYFTTDTSGEFSNQAETVKAMIKAHYLRKYLSDKGIMPELSEMTALSDDGNPQLNFVKACTEHIQALVRSGVTALATLSPVAQAATKDLSAMNATGDGSDSGSSDDTGGGSDDGFGDDFGGGGAFDTGDDGFGAPPAADDTAPAEEASDSNDDDAAAKEQESADQAQDAEKEKKDKEAADKAEADKKAKDDDAEQ